jgi:hypothetical protein
MRYRTLAESRTSTTGRGGSELLMVTASRKDPVVLDWKETVKVRLFRGATPNELALEENGAAGDLIVQKRGVVPRLRILNRLLKRWFLRAWRTLQLLGETEIRPEPAGVVTVTGLEGAEVPPAFAARTW